MLFTDQRKSAAQNLCQRGPVGPRKFTEAAHNFILRQHRQFVNANRRGCIQSRPRAIGE